MTRAVVITTWTLIFLLITIVLVFAGIRVGTDGPLIVTGTPAQGDAFERRYVEYPWLAYLHIVPGVLYLLGAPLQLWRRFRDRHFTFHRRFGRAPGRTLLLAYRAIRSGDVRMHRRWMIRAFAVGLGVGTIRNWVGIFVGFQIFSLEASFAPAFWLGLSMHVIAGELWLWWRPDADADGLPCRTRVPAAEAS
ncbi:DUF2306 domain-containing protein [Agromyces sp. NPDC049794]|uniref:DUF2306 domain-containing protein n=1 Tax=unclassified Agromyces TaxID=2639701 RepID=UPI0033C0F015